jgi:hypothetical protein
MIVQTCLVLFRIYTKPKPSTSVQKEKDQHECYSLMKPIMDNTTRLGIVAIVHKTKEPIHMVVVGASTTRTLDLYNVVQVGFN